MNNNKKIGLDDYLMKHSDDEFRKLMEDAKTPQRPQITLIKQNISEIPKFIDKMELYHLLKEKVFPLFLELDEIEINILLETDIKTQFELTPKEIKKYEKEVKALKKKKIDETTTGTIPEENKPYQMTDEEKKEAMEFLANPKLIPIIIQDIETTGYIGEYVNGFVLYLTGTSRKMNNPLNLVFKAPSASGKSAGVDSIVKLMPKEEIFKRDSVSKKVLAYLGDELCHKWVIFNEKGLCEEYAEQQMRLIQDGRENGLEVTVTIGDPKTGFSAKTYTLKGPFATTETTVNPTLDYQNETRVITLSCDCSEEQTKRIHKYQAQKKKSDYIFKEKEIEKISKKHQNAQRLLQPVRIFIDFADLITFPTHDNRNRRDFPKFLALIEAIVFLRQFQKEIKDIDGVKCIFADIGDYTYAYEFGKIVFAETIDVLSKPSRELLIKIGKLADEKKEKLQLDNEITPPDEYNNGLTLTRAEICYRFNMRESELRKYIYPLEQNGYLIILRGGGRGQKVVYDLNLPYGASETPEITELPTPEELNKKIKEREQSSSSSQNGCDEVKSLKIKELV